MIVAFPLLVGVSSVGLKVAMLPSNCRYICNSVDSIVLRTVRTHFSSVPETICPYMDRREHDQSRLDLALSTVE